MSADRSMPQLMVDLGLGDEDFAAWQAAGLGEDALEDWVIDRVARRPSGDMARATYGSEDVHDFARRAIFEALNLGSNDHLLEVGCGGGLLLRDAMVTGASATGIDHSEDMVALAGERAPESDVTWATAERLPFPDSAFTAVAMSIVFCFLENPVSVLRECRRVLAPDGQIAIYTSSPELRGTPAAPEPIASRGHFYSDDELVELGRRAGFEQVHVVNDNGGQLLTGRK